MERANDGKPVVNRRGLLVSIAQVRDESHEIVFLDVFEGDAGTAEPAQQGHESKGIRPDGVRGAAPVLHPFEEAIRLVEQLALPCGEVTDESMDSGLAARSRRQLRNCFVARMARVGALLPCGRCALSDPV